ncbi:MAG: GNAT family N-acetyltransferase [Chloroflexi bacterium]|nr:GNAT family N-acetyltransferase [Chloroflexota bacterium]
MIRTLTPPHPSSFSGLRQVDLRRDLRAIADLITEAFAGEIDSRGLSSLRELRTLARLGPLLYLLVPTNGELGSFFRGFVWEEDGKIVGNVTIQQIDASQQRWMISNVAVRAERRGQGIARKLMNAALKRIVQLGGEWAILQVRANNDIARGLYQRLGFSDVVAEVDLRCYPEPLVPTLPFPEGGDVRPMASQDLQSLRSLVQQSVPQLARWWQPQGRKQLYRGGDAPLLLSLKRLFGFTQYQRWGVYFGSRLGGFVDLKIAPQGSHHIDILLHPDLRQEWTRPLLTFCLQQLQPYGPQATTAHLYDYQTQAIEILQEFGFRRTQTLITMRKHVP